ncbi:hypothetical protein DPEC_G00212970 [Dallia pectoralis]|uniref:Uncharacterized protein n=1 Tax=Dallia pectoralis TaxID=75939 RepID=A0ACC2G6J7_DALPE|nr:hypothetical protein DPEC_G00212970 [Dallia pectoralis]
MSEYIILSLIGFLILCLIGTVVVAIVYSGLLTEVHIKTGSPPIRNVTIVYKLHRGPTRDCGAAFTETVSIGPKLKTIRVSYDDFTETPEDQCRYIVGSILCEGEEKPDEELQKLYEKFGFKVMFLPEVSLAVTTTFPSTTPLSHWLASYRVYPELCSYITERQLHAWPIIEVNTGDLTHYMAPLSSQSGTRHAGFNVPEPTTPTAVNVPELTTPTAAIVPELTTPTAAIVPELTTPTAAIVPELTTPMAVNVSELTTPTAVNVPKLTTPTAVNVPELTTPTAAIVPELTTPTAVNVPELTTPTAEESLNLIGQVDMSGTEFCCDVISQLSFQVQSENTETSHPLSSTSSSASSSTPGHVPTSTHVPTTTHVPSSLLPHRDQGDGDSGSSKSVDSGSSFEELDLVEELERELGMEDRENEGNAMWGEAKESEEKELLGD